jgi:hypothetical protein
MGTLIASLLEGLFEGIIEFTMLLGARRGMGVLLMAAGLIALVYAHYPLGAALCTIGSLLFAWGQAARNRANTQDEVMKS